MYTMYVVLLWLNTLQRESKLQSDTFKASLDVKLAVVITDTYAWEGSTGYLAG